MAMRTALAQRTKAVQEDKEYEAYKIRVYCSRIFKILRTSMAASRLPAEPASVYPLVSNRLEKLSANVTHNSQKLH